MNEFNSVIGSVYLKDVVIPPGSKVFSAQMHLGERVTNSKGVSQVLSDYLTAATVPVTIIGSDRSTKIAPLSPALSSVKLTSSMSGIHANLISGIAVKGSIIGLIFQKKATSQITLQNPMDTSYAIKSIKASVVFRPTSGAEPFTVGTIDYNLPNSAVVPAGGSMKTDDWPVTIEGSGPEHLIQLLGMLFDKEKYFDVEQNVTVIVGGAYESEMFYYQDRVPFTLSIDNLPPIGIEPSTISAQSLPKNLTSISDPDEFQNMLSKFLSGKTSLDDPSPSLSASPSTKSSTSNTSTSSTTQTSTTTTKEKDTPTISTEPSKTTAKETSKETKTVSEDKSVATTSSESKPAETTSDKHWFSLPF